MSPSRFPDPFKTVRPTGQVADIAVATAYAPAPSRPSVGLDKITTASATPRGGWVIQIASLETQAEAMAYLNAAQQKAKPILGAKQPFIENFEKNGVNYHRARFSGFNSKSEAWGACEGLKKHNYACLAFEN